MFRYDPATGKSEQVFEGSQVGGLVVQEDGSILQLMQEGRVQIWRGGKVTTVCESIEAERETRFNDATADPSGQVLAGTMPDPQGRARLYRFDLQGKPKLLLDDVGQSNGMAFTLDRQSLFHTDTKRKQIRRYRYGEALSDGEVIVTVSQDEVVPDGLTMDSKGTLLSAQWGGSCVACYRQDGSSIGKIPLPTPQVSSVAFGGEDYSELYVTTAGGQDRAKYGPEAGALFRVKATVTGIQPLLSRIQLSA
jgi:sugar lactone lactonase YvrE